MRVECGCEFEDFVSGQREYQCEHGHKYLVTAIRKSVTEYISVRTHYQKKEVKSGED